MPFERLLEMQYGKIEKSEKERRDVETIENLDLGKQNRMNLILAYLGKKPTSEIMIGYNERVPFEELEESLVKKRSLERVLSTIGLKFRVSEKESIDEDGFELKIFEFFVGRDERKIEELKDAFLKQDHEKTGKLLGYPETAIEAFVKEEGIFDRKSWWESLPEKEREKLLEEGVLNFLNFALSKRHWREELELVRKWQRIIREKAPKLYQEFIKRKPSFAMTEEEKNQRIKKEIEEELKKVQKKVEKITERLGRPIEKGIKETVVMLNAFGIRTSGFCEGRFRKEEAQAPWVEVESKISQIENWEENENLRERAKKQNAFFQRRMMNLLNLFYQERKVPFDQRLHLRKIGNYGAFRLESQGAYFLEKEMKKEKFEQYKKEMKIFTDFLKEQYPKYFLHLLEV
jgi:hypothetical protein